MENKENILTEEQLDQAADIMKTNAENSPKTQVLRKVLDGNKEVDEAYDKLLDSKLIEIETDIDENKFKENIGILVDGANNSKNPIMSSMDINDEDAAELYKLMTTYKSSSTVNIYNKLPDKVRKYIDRMASMYGITGYKALNDFTKVMIESMIQEMQIDKEFSNFQKQLNDELNIPSILDMHAEFQKDILEDKLFDKADALEEKDQEKANILRSVANAYKDSYTFTKQTELLESDPKIIASIRKNCGDKLFNRHCDYFDFKMSKAKIKCKPIREIIPIIMRVSDTNSDIAKRFVYLLCKVSENMSYEKNDELWFMYNSVNNIINLAYLAPDKRTGFSQQLINNLNRFLDYITGKEEKDCEV